MSGGGAVGMRVVLVGDRQLMRDDLARAFEAAGDVQVVGEGSSVAEGLLLINGNSPDVLVTDVSLPHGNGIQLTEQVRSRSPSIGIVVVTSYTGDNQMFDALAAGASGFVGKGASSEEVVSAARHAQASPRSFTAGDLGGAMMWRMIARPGPLALSPRERQVLDLLLDGLAVNQVARRLYIAEATTRTHVLRIYEKLHRGIRA